MLNKTFCQCPTTEDILGWQFLFFKYTSIDLKSTILCELYKNTPPYHGYFNHRLNLNIPNLTFTRKTMCRAGISSLYMWVCYGLPFCGGEEPSVHDSCELFSECRLYVSADIYVCVLSADLFNAYILKECGFYEIK